MNHAFEKAAGLLLEIEKAGYEAYFVGGSVRDFLLKKKISDVDIATSATPQEIKQIFSRTIDVGIEHGTVIVLYQGETYEVTTFRSESEYEDFRRPADVVFIRSLHEDLKRRDFTMNAIAMDKNGMLIDPFKGQEAIFKQKIKTVGKAEERFHEDALRMMRAVRFVSQLAFSMDDSTYQALIKHGSLLKNISIERITVEFEKLLQGRDRSKALQILLDTELFQYLPLLKDYKEELIRFTQHCDQLFSIEELWTLLVYHLQMEQKQIEGFLRTWKLPLKKIKHIQKNMFWVHERFSRNWQIEDVYEAGLDIVISTEKLYNKLSGLDLHHGIDQLEYIYDSLPIKSRSDLSVTGTDFLSWFEKGGGPWIKEKLNLIEKKVLQRKVENEKEKIREWLMRCNQN